MAHYGKLCVAAGRLLSTLGLPIRKKLALKKTADNQRRVERSSRLIMLFKKLPLKLQRGEQMKHPRASY